MLMKKKNKSHKEVLIKEILKIYEVIYDYERNDLIYCYNELKYNKSYNEIKYINHRLKQINENEIQYLDLFKYD